MRTRSSVEKIEAQAREFLPELVCLYDASAAADLKLRLADTSIRVVSGPSGLEEAAAGVPADIVSLSLLGMIGIRPTLAAIRAGRDCAFANKETLVCAGHLIMPAVKAAGTRFLPVDSEHGAVFQCLQGEDPARVSRLLITASGGPFRGKKKEELPVTHFKTSAILPATLAGLGLWALIWWILSTFTNSTVPITDAFTTALSIVAMWTLAREYAEHWLMWLVWFFALAGVGNTEFLVQRHGDWYLSCYGAMALCCLILALIVYYMYRSCCEDAAD